MQIPQILTILPYKENYTKSKAMSYEYELKKDKTKRKKILKKK